MKLMHNAYRALVCPVCGEELQMIMVQTFRGLTAYIHDSGGLTSSPEEDGDLEETRYTEVYCPRGHFRIAVENVEL